MAISNPFSTSQGISQATKKAAAQTKLTKTGAAKQVDVTKAGYRKGREALAPAITNIGDIYAGAKAGYDVAGGLRGIPGFDQTAAQKAYQDYAAPLDLYGLQDLERYGATTGTLASGGTQKDLYDWGYQTRFKDYLAGLDANYNPLAANIQQGNLASKLAGLDVGQGTDLSGIFGNKFNTLAGIQGNKYDTIAGVQQNAAGNVLQAGIAGVNTLGQAAGMAMNPAGSLASKLPQYAANVYGPTQPQYGPVVGQSNTNTGWFGV